MNFRPAFFYLCLLSAVAPVAAAQKAVTAPAARSESIPNLGPLLDRVNALKADLRHYHDCAGAAGCYAKDLDQQADRAITLMRTRAAHRKSGEKLALVLDIDETALSNWAEMVAANFEYNSFEYNSFEYNSFEYNSEDFNAWVESAQAPAIPGTLRLFKAAEDLGVSVFFITGRPETQCASTEANLRIRGFDKWEQLILRSADQQNLTAEQYKSTARRIVATRFRIVLKVGDQWSDLRGPIRLNSP